MVANFTLATSDRQKGRQGNWQERTEWHNLVAFARTAEIVRDYVQKGSKLYIEGKIQTRWWDDKRIGRTLPHRDHRQRHLVAIGPKEGSSGGYGQPQALRPTASAATPPGGDDIGQSAEISDDDIRSDC